MIRSSPPPVDPREALDLLNALRQAFAEAPIAKGAADHDFMAELREAYPLLTMLAPKARAAETTPDLLDELRHNWNKALRRRGWRRLPALPAGAPAGADAEARRVEAFLSFFGVDFDAAGCPADSLTDAAALASVLADRVETLRGPPLPSPAEYARELAALTQAWNELVAVHPGLPRIG